ncbi:crotonobetainyl-CoA:carnitine CoA-transferase [Nocardia sp. NRRL S-836]|nr:crotonobetainyl-CoA:carnitine CoA-transferase [Nocardia sp. NRRL S-836]
MAAKRDYGQFCGLAGGLNVVGERWTLLVVRELLIGPARFNDMMDNLAGIGPNLLADRLRTLVTHGVVEQAAVPGDGRGKLYRLTALGEELREPVLGLAKWGMGFLGDAGTGVVRAEWGFLAVQSMIVRDRVPAVDEVYQFDVGEEVFTIEVRAGQVTFSRAAAEAPTLRITCEPDTFIRIGARMLTPFDAIVTGAVKIEGPNEAIHRCTRLLGLVD